MMIRFMKKNKLGLGMESDNECFLCMLIRNGFFDAVSGIFGVTLMLLEVEE